MNFSISNKNNPGVNKYGPLPCPNNCFSGDIDGYNVQYTDTWTFSPTLVNEFRMAYTKQGNWFIPQTIGYNAEASLGLQYAKADILPTMNIGGPGFCCAGIAPGTNAVYIENLYDPSDVVTLIKGKHILHFGVEVLMGQGNTTRGATCRLAISPSTASTPRKMAHLLDPPELAWLISCSATSSSGAQPIRRFPTPASRVLNFSFKTTLRQIKPHD